MNDKIFKKTSDVQLYFISLQAALN